MMRRAPLALLLLAAASMAQAQTWVDAEVRKVDKPQGKLTLRHAEIKNLDMPAMTMVFHVRDKGVLEQVNAGDKVKFKAVNESGKYFATEIQVVK